MRATISADGLRRAVSDGLDEIMGQIEADCMTGSTPVANATGW